MKAFRVSKDNDIPVEEKIKLIDTYDTGDVLYVVREYEEVPRRFEEDIVKALGKRLLNKGIICM